MSITRDVDGLIDSDDFNRANGTVGGGWTEGTPGNWGLDRGGGNYLAHTDNAIYDPTGVWKVSSPVLPAPPYVIQVNARNIETGANPGAAYLLVEGVVAGDTEYQWGMEGGNRNFNLRKRNAGGDDWFEDGTGWSDNTWYGLRLMVTESGGDITLKGHATAALTDREDLSKAFVLLEQHTDIAALPPQSGTYYGFAAYDGVDFDNYFLFRGFNLVVTGLPTGYKIKIDGRSAVAESGGTVTIDVSLWALPATTIKVLTAGDVEVDTLTPSGGIWGGDEYSFSSPTPTNLVASTAGTNRVNLDWDDVSGATSYKVYRETPTGGGFALVHTVTGPAPVSLWADLTGEDAKEYNYRVTALVGAVESSPSNEDDATTTMRTPTVLSATVISTTRIDLAYNNNSQNADGYKIERESPIGGGFSEIDDIGDVGTYSDVTVVGGTEYNYRVRGYNALPVVSNYSIADDATTSVAIPTGFEVTKFDEASIGAHWVFTGGADGFKVERESPKGGGFSLLTTINDGTVRDHIDTSLDASTQYNYRVKAFDGGGDSSASGEADATTDADDIFASTPAPGEVAEPGAGIHVIRNVNNIIAIPDQAGVAVGTIVEPTGNVLYFFYDPRIQANTWLEETKIVSDRDADFQGNVAFRASPPLVESPGAVGDFLKTPTHSSGAGFGNSGETFCCFAVFRLDAEDASTKELMNRELNRHQLLYGDPGQAKDVTGTYLTSPGGTVSVDMSTTISLNYHTLCYGKSLLRDKGWVDGVLVKDQATSVNPLGHFGGPLSFLANFNTGQTPVTGAVGFAFWWEDLLNTTQVLAIHNFMKDNWYPSLA